MPGLRLRAVRALSAVGRGVLPKVAIDEAASGLDQRDRNFLTEVVYGVLRYRITLDWMIDHVLKDRSRLPAFTLDNLRSAVYQLVFMRVPDRAAVHEAVQTEKTAAPKASTVPLVNAVLRNLIRRKAAVALPVQSDDPVTAISVNTSHPAWMVSRWIARFGEHGALQLAEANNSVPRLTIRTHTLRTTRDELLDLLRNNGIDGTATAFSPDGITLAETRAFSTLSCAKGLFLVQDEASQLISFLVAPRPGERVLDACAAPGGKTTHMAQMMHDEGEVIAVEKDRARAARLRENVAGLGLQSVSVVEGDIRSLAGLGSFDRVLVDAPCSSTGVIRRNPDVKYRHSAADLLRHADEQRSLLSAASRMLRPSGVLVYSVCSTEPEEGEDVADAFLQASPEFRIIEPRFDFLERCISRGFFRTFPHTHTMDGFFGMSICRTA